MHPSAMAFACSALTAGDVRGKTVIEAGALDVNGSIRGHVESLGPASYTGTDIRPGPGVDVLADAAVLARVTGRADVLICLEMLEHAEDWRAAMAGLVDAVATGGILVLTTRSAGFPYHGYPDDYHRFPVEAMGEILAAAGLEVERLEPDPAPGHPGVFARARKPPGWACPDDLAEAWADVKTGPPC